MAKHLVDYEFTSVTYGGVSRGKARAKSPPSREGLEIRTREMWAGLRRWRQRWRFLQNILSQILWPNHTNSSSHKNTSRPAASTVARLCPPGCQADLSQAAAVRPPPHRSLAGGQLSPRPARSHRLYRGHDTAWQLGTDWQVMTAR